MLLKFARRKVGQAMGAVGSPLTGGRGIGWPALKRLLVIGTVTVGLVVFVSNLDGKTRGTGPLLIAAAGFLVGLLDFHRHDKRIFGLLLGVVPISMLVALAAGRWHFTKGATDQATLLGNDASMTGANKLVDLTTWAGTVGAPAAFNWCIHEGGPALVDTIGKLAGSLGGGS